MVIYIYAIASHQRSKSGKVHLRRRGAGIGDVICPLVEIFGLDDKLIYPCFPNQRVLQTLLNHSPRCLLLKPEEVRKYGFL